MVIQQFFGSLEVFFRIRRENGLVLHSASTLFFFAKKTLMLLELNRKPQLNGWKDRKKSSNRTLSFKGAIYAVCRKGTSSQTLFLVNFI